MWERVSEREWVKDKYCWSDNMKEREKESERERERESGSEREKIRER